MDRRFFAWFLLLTSLYFLFIMQRQRTQLAEQQAALQAEMEARDAAAAQEAAKARLANALANANLELPPEPPLEYFTFGSYSSNEKRPLILTLTNQGAGVDRIELVARDADGNLRYRSLDNRSGYPGYLAFHATGRGLQIMNITDGSPAQKAASTNPNLPDGLKVGDVLIGVAGVPVKSLNEYQAAIEAFDAGKTVRFSVARPASPNLIAPIPPVNEDSVEYLTLANHDQPEALVEIRKSAAKQPLGEVTSIPAKSPTPAPKATAPAEEAKPSDAAENTEETKEESATSESAKPQSEVAEVAAQDAELLNIDPLADATILHFDVELVPQPLDVVRNTERYPAEQVNGNEQRTSLLTTLASIDGISVKEGKQFIEGLDALLARNWTGKRTADGDGIDFELPLRAFLAAQGIDADLTLVKSYRLRPFDASAPLQNYDFEYSITVRNDSDKPHTVSVRQEGMSGLTLEGWWYSVKQSAGFSAAGARDVVLARRESSHEMFNRRAIQDAARSDALIKEVPLLGPGDGAAARNLRYLGVDSQYFVAALLPPKNTRNGLDNLSRAAATAIADVKGDNAIAPYKDIAMNVGFYFDGPEIEVTKDRNYIANYRVFAGPKEPEILKEYGLGDTVYYGWSIFGTIAIALTWILHAFYYVVQNYGIAIIMLTILVRSCMFPLSWKASVMGQRMQELAPELKKINELYKDDLQKRGIETQKLYKKYKLNPMASCLPVFIQLPIFIGLYRAVSTDVALRQKPLVPGWDWCNNLAGPDQLALWPSWMFDYFAGKGDGWFGPYINLLPIATCILFIVQQKVLMPKATDEQTLMTQRVMMFMTVFMGILFFKVPAGLCIYFITSSIWSLVERKLVKKFLPPAKLVAVPEGPIADEPQKPKLENRLQNMANAKPPEKLSEVLPWLKKQLQRPADSVPPPAETNQHLRRRKRKSK